MKFNHVCIAGVGHAEAPIRVTSSELEARLASAQDRLQMKPDLIVGLTGIVARRFWEPGKSFSQVATRAGEVAIADAGIDRSRIGIVISTSVCKEFLEPSVACHVHRDLGLSPDCINLDLGNACLAFMNAIDFIGNMIELGQIEYGLIVDGEGSRQPVESTIQRLLAPDSNVYTLFENFATLTLGSGGAAMVLARSDLAPDGHPVLGGVTLAATQHNRLCQGTLTGMVTDASGLLKAGLELAGATWEKACREMGWQGDCLDHYITHQISSVHTRKFAQLIGLDERKLFKTYPEYGNIGPAAVPYTMAKAIEAGVIEKGDRVGFMGIGSGLNCTMMEVIW